MKCRVITCIKLKIYYIKTFIESITIRAFTETCILVEIKTEPAMNELTN